MKLVNGKRSQLLEYLMIIAGTGLMALAINSVFDASGMVTGGFSGIAIIIKAGSQGIIDGGIPLWVTNMGLNIPLFLIGWKINGFSFVKKALIGEIALSTWLAIEPVWNLAGNDLLLAALYGGVIQGVGIGLVFLGGGTTGGTDMMAAIIQKYLQHYSISKAAYIITAKPKEIADMIMKDLDRGVTGISARGMYSGQDKLMLFCVVNKKEIVMLKEKVDEIDPEAFVIVTDAREVHGEGFIEKK